jgi:hypothetical protein
MTAAAHPSTWREPLPRVRHLDATSAGSPAGTPIRKRGPDRWGDLVDRWHAFAIRALDEHHSTESGECSGCHEHWPCATAASAAFALEVHADA